MTTDSDVATVLALEEPAKALFEAIKAAQPAMRRLDKAGYAGIDDVETQLQVINTGNDDAIGELVEVVKAFRAAQGNPGAFDYHYFVGHFGQTVGETARQILDMGDADKYLKRVESLRQYAATVAR